MKDSVKGNIALLTTALIWGSGFVAQKLGMNYIGPFAFNGMRQIIASIILIPLSHNNDNWIFFEGKIW